ncbi:30S ribosomal protein S12 methylthiotransferase RimO [Pseudodesulfovibrio sp. F-1]|uniref:Ribosomal protein uS12 methylthiotransferase RimO n=1 Tax=Pseudodesulfovibrio alkaliphilus TaxID=2661613 RepID=A0A7K1KP59_9BACT|nr:30S ribosomal protein S12 methylthiotransferase RimO [Pseudodesulfovibrio alkaliphilus]MUM77681.1 30S ribosomal protein S12 methylthiotransferase RimO [Pseudodesulfovibrio alkaliphilus]
MTHDPAAPLAVFTVSLGCPKNLVDTERLLGVLGPGMVPTDSVAGADLALINTCGFIQPAVEESVAAILDAVREADEARETTGRRPLVAVAGCLVSRYGQDLRDELPEVDLWLSTDQIALWPGMIGKAIGRARIIATPGIGDAPRRLSTGPAFAYLKISEGCSHNCRFCTIPAIRGPHRSRPKDALLAEAHTLAASVPEIVIVGQDSTAYGTDLGGDNTIRNLVAGLAEIPGISWLRLMYLYPAGLTDDLLGFLKSVGEPLLPYFDIPLQHAHPDVLASMGRPFARNPRKVIDRVRNHFPEAALRTTFIVGYPGETEEHFDQLMRFVEETRFHHLGVFPYWPEDGTPAAAMPHQVDQETKLARRDALMALQADISREIMESHVGQTLPVLIEDPSPEWPGLHLGRAWFQAPEVDGTTYVAAPPDKPLTPGTIVQAEIDKADTYDLSGLV